MNGASAPGKVVLTGEYAVLDGAPAIVTAVDRRARVTIDKDTAHRVTAQGPGIAPAAFTLAPDGTPGWDRAGAGDDYRLLGAVTQTLADCGRLPVDRPFGLQLDTAAFYRGADKLGLGSSAALTVALAAALNRHFGHAFDDGLAFAAHRRLQDGEGSGLDVAASIAGGVIRYTVGQPPSVEQIGWPAGLEVSFVWTGCSARTTPRLRRYRDWRRSGAAAPLADRLAEDAAQTAAAWQAAEPAAVLETTAAWARRLAELDEAAGLGIRGGGHAEIARLAETAGVVYKPSGAGGGDLGLALAGDRERLRSFGAAAERAGFRPLALRPDDRGLATVE